MTTRNETGINGLELVASAELGTSGGRIAMGDIVYIKSSGEYIPTTVEEICVAPVEFLIKLRIDRELYTSINSKYIEYRNYGEKGFYRTGQ